MTATVAPTTTTTTTTTAPTTTSTSTRRSHPVLKATMVAGVVAAAAATALAAAAHAAGVPLAVDGEQIPLLGFAQMTFIGAVLGGVILAALNRWSGRARQRFQVIAAALTVASCAPSVALPPDTATKLTLVATHLVAAAIIVPVLARRAAR
jgi:Family of unknown function (DUF6069)